MKALEQKLEQLSLTTMSQQLEAQLAEAATRNLSFAQTLESLVDRELEARSQRSVERRFRLSRLPDKPSIDAFHFNTHKSRQQARSRILRLLDLDFVATGANVCIIGNPGVGKTFLAKIIGWRACQANQRVLFTTAMDMLNQLLASQVDHSLVRKLRLYTDPKLLVIDELGYFIARSTNIQSVLSGHLHPARRKTFYRHYHQHSLLRVGQHSLQHHHRHCY